MRSAGSGLSGPFDADDAPDDGANRVNFGSVRVPVPDGAQLQVEMDPASSLVRAVHVLTPLGQFTVSAYAAPPSGGLWEEVRHDLAETLREDGAVVQGASGGWGPELVAVLDKPSSGDVVLRFVGVDGPGWLLRGVAACPRASFRHGASTLRDLVRGTVVVRGTRELPDRTPLPIELPAEIASAIDTQQH
ncbi:DUF3710 domain-containing protein [Amycolatopsis sp.]|uniref:DUF3710 domain-containing protein n=1 Tax=Amycolatopsis sp. TaxID=37632 RepID=UPI002D7FDBF5|nr:DUF3710 domain-containing protein [Amycolatopsis sp.]HET6704628.1 DUF3710 domain-containing protein [Amycolatopsis sp.]